MVDGDTSTSGALDYAVHPTSANGRNITFSYDETYRDASFVFHSRTYAGNRIDGSTVSVRLNGTETHNAVLNISDAVNHVITLVTPDGTMFDQVVLTFDGASQNFREIEIFATPQVSTSLSVRATAGSISRDRDVLVTVSDVNEAPVAVGTPAEQTVNEGATAQYTLPAGLFSDPEGDALTLSADLGSGTPLPSWIQFDANDGKFTFTPQNGDDGKTDIYVYASDGNLQGSIDFSVTVDDVL